jgi:hypothetical protein
MDLVVNRSPGATAVNAMNSDPKPHSALYTELGYKPLHRQWAKLEIAIGLMAAGAGILLGQWIWTQDLGDASWAAPAALALFVLGGYLTLAGHRSHLYQSNNELTAYLAAKIHDLNHKGFPNEHLDR